MSNNVLMLYAWEFGNSGNEQWTKKRSIVYSVLVLSVRFKTPWVNVLPLSKSFGLLTNKVPDGQVIREGVSVKVTDGQVVRAGVSVTWNVLSWFGGYELGFVVRTSVLSCTWSKNMLMVYIGVWGVFQYIQHGPFWRIFTSNSVLSMWEV